MAELDLDLGAGLRDVAAHLDVADVPDLGARVAAQIDAAGLRPPVVQRRVRRAVIALVAVVIGGASATAAPAVADWLRQRVGGVEIRRDETPVPAPNTESDLGRRTTLAEAQRAAPFPVRKLGAPYSAVQPEVWVDDIGGITVVSLVYGDILLQQFAAPLADRATMTKLVGGDTVVEEVEVEGDGVRGLWIEGAHGIVLRTGDVGDVGDDQLRYVPSRRASNTLVWEVGGVTHRLESSLDRSPALARASTLQ